MSGVEAYRYVSTVRRTTSVWPVALLVAAAVASLAALIPETAALVETLRLYVPLDPFDGHPILAVLTAVGLLAVVIGLLRGKRVSWWLAVATFAVSLLAQARRFDHPLPILVVVGGLAILLADRRRYEVETEVAWRSRAAALLVVAGLALVAEAALVVAATGAWPASLSFVANLTSWAAEALGVDDGASQSILDVTSRGGLLVALLIAARLPVVLASIGVLRRIPEPLPDPAARYRRRSIALRHGRGALLPFQLGDDKAVFVPADVDGAIAYGVSGRTAVVVGDPIAQPQEMPRLIAAFVKQSARLDRAVAFYQVTQSARAGLIGAGFRLFRVGQEAIIDLPTFDLSGCRRANLRHTVTRARKGGITVQFYPDGCASLQALMPDLAAIDAAWRRGTGPQMGFTISRFDCAELARVAVAVAFDEAGRPAAFATFRETGSDGGWVLDLIRRLPGSVPGALEYCIVEAALAFKAQGSPTLSLGLAPLYGLDPHDGPAQERVLATAAGLVKRWYDVRGLAFFKNKFDPRWEPRYAAIGGRAIGLGLAIALLRLHLRRPRAASADCPHRDVLVPATD